MFTSQNNIFGNHVIHVLVGHISSGLTARVIALGKAAIIWRRRVVSNRPVVVELIEVVDECRVLLARNSLEAHLVLHYGFVFIA